MSEKLTLDSLKWPLYDEKFHEGPILNCFCSGTFELSEEDIKMYGTCGGNTKKKEPEKTGKCTSQ